MTTFTKPHGLHLVGSLPFSSTREAMTACARALGPYLKRLPDGEIGHGRHAYVGSQIGVLPPGVLPPHVYQFAGLQERDVPPDETKLACAPTRYDDWALESYAEFNGLRDQGAIPRHVRFQVGIPSVASVLLPLVKPEWRSRVEAEYEKVLFDALAHIQRRIPHHDLAIQIDCGSDLSFIDGFQTWPGLLDYRKWFPEPHYDGVLARLLKLGNRVAAGVQLGYHLCYGDVHGKHLIEPRDLGSAVRLLTGLDQALARRLDFVQMPVPRDRTDDAFFAPLKSISEGSRVELVLGGWHPDRAVTARILAAAGKTGVPFALSSECGLGRHAKEETESFLEAAPALVTPPV